MSGALEGIRVVEAGESIAVAMAGRWLEALGAEVLKVEAPAGDPSRRYNPLGPGASVAAAEGALLRFLNAGKRSLRLDLGEDAGRSRLRRLALKADVLFHDRSSRGAGHPRLVEVEISDFPQGGPYSSWAGAPNVLLALGGYQYLTGDPDRAPLALPGFQPDYLAGLHGAVAGLAGLTRRQRSGRGGRFAVSALEVLASLHQYTFSKYLRTGVPRRRNGHRWEDVYVTTLPCRDGWVTLSAASEEYFQRLCLMLERPDLLDDPRFAGRDARTANGADLDAIVVKWLRGIDRAEFFRRAQEEWRLPWGPMLSLEEVLADAQPARRGFWVSDGSGRKLPGIPAVLGATPWRLGRAPTLGEHDVLLEALLARPRAGPPPPPGATGGPYPLRGVRVLDFSRVWSGPLCARILADLGAEVIRIDQPPPEAPPPPSAAQSGLVELHRNKLSLALDLNLEAGRDVVRRLVAVTDVLIENFSARVMPNFGLAWEALRATNPALVMLSMPAFGASGPYGSYAGAGPSIEP
jgi:crotonobetainyl-CoA:carnitine CoA-transferase CaiB-like acyl-CoA transferase